MRVNAFRIVQTTTPHPNNYITPQGPQPVGTLPSTTISTCMGIDVFTLRHVHSYNLVLDSILQVKPIFQSSEYPATR